MCRLSDDENELSEHNLKTCETITHLSIKRCCLIETEQQFDTCEDNRFGGHIDYGIVLFFLSCL